MDAIPRVFDQFTADHFSTWLGRVVFEEDRTRVERDIFAYLHEYPEALTERGLGWTEIRNLAEGCRRLDR